MKVLHDHVRETGRGIRNVGSDHFCAEPFPEPLHFVPVSRAVAQAGFQAAPLDVLGNCLERPFIRPDRVDLRLVPAYLQLPVRFVAPGAVIVLVEQLVVMLGDQLEPQRAEELV